MAVHLHALHLFPRSSLMQLRHENAVQMVSLGLGTRSWSFKLVSHWLILRMGGVSDSCKANN